MEVSERQLRVQKPTVMLRGRCVVTQRNPSSPGHTPANWALPSLHPRNSHTLVYFPSIFPPSTSPFSSLPNSAPQPTGTGAT